jgi:hypothetical protein
MSAIAAIVLKVAAEIGAPMIKGMLENAAPGMVSEIGGKIIDAVAGKAGVAPERLPELAIAEPETVSAAVSAVEANMPELVALWSKGLDGQFALLGAETKEGVLQSAWRWGWMYLLGFFWVWKIVLLPVINHFLRLPIETIEAAILMTLTSWFLALYMGGHTLKEVAKSIGDVTGGWKK